MVTNYFNKLMELSQSKCDCNLCERSRFFALMLDNVSTDETKDYFITIFKTLYDAEFEAQHLNK